MKAFIFLEAECYWFLKCLFFAYVLAWITYQIKYWKIFVAIAFCFLFMMLQYYGQTFFKMGIMLPCFYIGMFLRYHLHWIELHKGIVGWGCAILFFCLFPYFSSADLFANKFFQEITFSAWLHWAFCMTMGISGSIMVLCACMYLDKHFSHTCCLKLLNRIGNCTLGIYLIQKILLELLLPHWVKVRMNIFVFDLLFTPIVAILFLFLCYYVTLAFRET